MYLIYENEFNKNVHDEQDKLIRWINEAARLNPKAPLSVILSAAKAYVDGKNYAVTTLDGRFMGSNETIVEPEIVEEEILEEEVIEEEVIAEEEIEETVTEEEVDAAIEEMEEELHPVITHSVSQEESAEETPEEEEFISEEENIESTITLDEYIEDSQLTHTQEIAIISRAADVIAEAALEEEYALSEEEERQLLSVGEKKASINDAIDFSKRKKSRGSALAALAEENEGDDAIEAVIEERQDRKKRRPTTYNTGDEKQSRIRDNLVAIYTNIDDLQDL